MRKQCYEVVEHLPSCGQYLPPCGKHLPLYEKGYLFEVLKQKTLQGDHRAFAKEKCSSIAD